ncbi:MAG: 50S ribosomal protein L25 [Planctomycetes bacterium]|nr:50S ribosomal protein L25 [Planctomycetota bacterium]
MAEEAVLKAQIRKRTGSAECRRLRRQGVLPGTVYGHREDAVAIAVPADRFDAIVHGGHRVVEMELDGHNQTALLQDVQWDPLGISIQHFDLLRVDRNERVTVDVTIVLRGTAPGAVAGGVVEHQLHKLSIECPAVGIPDSIVVRIGELQIGQSIHVGDLELPEGVTVLTSADQPVVQVVEAVEAEEPTGEEIPGPVEPELVRRKEEAAEGED